MDALRREWNRSLAEEGLRVIASYGHTGNFVFCAAQRTATAQVNQVLQLVLRRRIAVFGAENYLTWLTELKLATSERPVTGAGRRATPGAVMDLNPEGATPEQPPSTERISFGSFAVPRVRLTWKRDILRDGGDALDKKRREGGWGAVAKAMRDALGGEWTARALSSLEGVAAQLERVRVQ